MTANCFQTSPKIVSGKHNDNGKSSTRLDVLDQGALEGEGLAALAAGERLLSRVEALVVLDVVLVAEALVAEAALEVARSRAPPRVLLQSFLVGEYLRQKPKSVSNYVRILHTILLKLD